MHKVIFYVFLILETIGLIAIAADFPLKFIDTIAVIVELLGLFGLYSYIYHKKYLSPIFWKNTFYILGVWWVLDLLDLMLFGGALWGMVPDFFQSGFDYSNGELMLGLLIQAYFLYIIYQLGFQTTKIQKTKKK